MMREYLASSITTIDQSETFLILANASVQINESVSQEEKGNFS